MYISEQFSNYLSSNCPWKYTVLTFKICVTHEWHTHDFYVAFSTTKKMAKLRMLNHPYRRRLRFPYSSKSFLYFSSMQYFILWRRGTHVWTGGEKTAPSAVPLLPEFDCRRRHPGGPCSGKFYKLMIVLTFFLSRFSVFVSIYYYTFRVLVVNESDW